MSFTPGGVEQRLKTKLSDQDREDIASGRKLIDYVSGTLVAATPEEVEATQPTARQLVEDYGYPIAHVRTRPQHRVKARPSGKKAEFPVDIAVFKDEHQRADDLYIVVEAKRAGSDSEEGDDRQLFNYLRLSNAEIGVWTNGSDVEYHRKVVVGNQITFEKIPSLPRFGESIDSIGKHRRNALIAPSQLGLTFRAIRNHLAGNAVGTTRDETLATQMINLVFCKIFDEKFKSGDQLMDFRAELGEEPGAVSKRVNSLFASVKAKYSDVFDPSDTITLDAASLTYVVGQLQPFSLLSAPRDAVGEAFEVFVGATLKGAQGQFFTPRNVVQLMVDIISPQPDELVIDPACGPAGFLVESLRSKWARLDESAARLEWSEAAIAEERASTAIKTIFGIEKDGFLAKVAKAYMAIMGDGKGGIFCEDSLDIPDKWSGAAKQHVALGKFDVVLANPPFGKDIKVKGAAKLEQYALGYQHRNGRKTARLYKSQNPQVLFVERCIQLAKDGGRIGIILPETYFHAPSTKHVRGMIASHNIMAVIDLPHNTFRPFNNAKCIAVIFEKNRPQQPMIRMIGAEEMGHNHQGKPLNRYDESTHKVTDQLWDDLSAALEELRSGGPSEYVFDVAAETVAEEDVLIPRYYWPRLVEGYDEGYPHDVDWITVREMIAEGSLTRRAGHGSPPAYFKGRGSRPYIRVKDIINWEIYRDPTSSIPETEFDRLVGDRPVKHGDVLYVSRGSYRIGDAALVGPDDESVAVTREIHVLSVVPGNKRGLSPEMLLYMLSTDAVARQTKARVFIDTTLPNIAERYLDIRLPWMKSADERASVAARVGAALSARWEAMSAVRTLLHEARPHATVTETATLVAVVEDEEEDAA